MSKPTYYKTLSSPQVFMWRMFLFVVLAGLLAATLQAQIITNFEANRYLNSLIIGVMAIGIIYAFQQVLRLYPEIRWVNNFRISDPGLSTERPPVMLAPMATLLRRRQGQAARTTISTSVPGASPASTQARCGQQPGSSPTQSHQARSISSFRPIRGR